MIRGLTWMMVLVCSLSASCADDPPCAELSGADCDTKRCSVLSARRVDAERMCLAASKAVGCKARDTSCPAALGLAQDPSGAVWSFSDLCFPEGWERFSMSFEGQPYPGTVPASWDRPCP